MSNIKYQQITTNSIKAADYQIIKCEYCHGIGHTYQCDIGMSDYCPVCGGSGQVIIIENDYV